MIPKFSAVNRLDGFDDGVNPHWQIVGVGCEKSALLSHGDGLSVKVRNPAVAAIVSDVSSGVKGRLITIKGLRKGATVLDVSDGKAIGTRLEIGVKNRREVRVSFHFVHDNAGHKSQRNPSDLQGWLNTINNQIFLPQANVFVRTGIVNTALTFNQNFGNVVREFGDKFWKLLLNLQKFSKIQRDRFFSR